uniref:Uncharacterized protein n=1 Tax=Zea mays TaxID=4577 RepID=A0A804M6L1_MAIZE
MRPISAVPTPPPSPARDPPHSLYASASSSARIPPPAPDMEMKVSASDETLAVVLDHLKPHTVGTFLPLRRVGPQSASATGTPLPRIVAPALDPCPHCGVHSLHGRRGHTWIGYPSAPDRRHRPRSAFALHPLPQTE